VPHLYYEALEPDPAAPFGYALLGVGLAPNFMAGGALSWTADRPRFGVAAAVVDEYLYAWGCAPARFLSADCFLARAPVDDLGGYEYARGSGHWTANADRAWPLVEASTEISVTAITPDRWLMAYAPPLSRSIVFRTGLTVAGPWSQPVTAATCAMPAGDPDAFCGQVVLHPTLETAPNTIALSYSVGTFSSVTVPRELALQLVAVEIPGSLP
jgi:hypothetical protein